MPISYDANGIPWLEPKHIDLRDLAVDLDKLGVDAATQKHQLTSAEWREAASTMSTIWRQGAGRQDIIHASVNSTLAAHALCSPPYGTVKNLEDIADLLNKTPPDIEGCQKLILAIVMQPAMRALQLVGRFMKLPVFEEFAYLIDAAALAFYRGNVPAAFMTILPVVEGVLLRWQGYPLTLANKPSFGQTVSFVRDTATRQPLPLLPLFFDSWAESAARIISDHLYRHTGSGPAVDYFNRHLALHLLEDQKFGTAENVTRAFLLLDVLSELYICEKRIRDPRWDTKSEEGDAHRKAYSIARISQGSQGQPEKVLRQFHPKCRP